MTAVTKSGSSATFLLDTNACIALINGQPASVRARFDGLSEDSQILVSTISAFELWYGVEKSMNHQSNAARLETFFASPFQLLSFENEDAKVAGLIRATLEKAGTPIGLYDLLIGAQALRHKAILVTSNQRGFRRIAGLSWEDWAKSGA